MVTGAGSGIGQAIAQRIADAGHRVVGLGRSPQKLDETDRSIPGGRFAGLAVDLADTKAAMNAVANVRARLEEWQMPLLGVVNNAGVFDRRAFTQSPDSLWVHQFENNLLSAVRLTRELYPELKRGSPSSVLNISSTLGIKPVADTSAYSAVKAAMLNWTRTLALEWAPDKIRVNAIAPGLVDTPIHPFHAQPANAPVRQQVNRMQPLGEVGQPRDISEAAWFLLSDGSRWTTGSTLTVDGGIGL